MSKKEAKTKDYPKLDDGRDLKPFDDPPEGFPYHLKESYDPDLPTRIAVTEDYEGGNHGILGNGRAVTAAEALELYAKHYAGTGQTVDAVSAAQIGSKHIWRPIPLGIGQANSILRGENGRLREHIEKLNGDISYLLSVIEDGEKAAIAIAENLQKARTSYRRRELAPSKVKVK